MFVFHMLYPICYTLFRKSNIFAISPNPPAVAKTAVAHCAMFDASGLGVVCVKIRKVSDAWKWRWGLSITWGGVIRRNIVQQYSGFRQGSTYFHICEPMETLIPLHSFTRPGVSTLRPTIFQTWQLLNLLNHTVCPICPLLNLTHLTPPRSWNWSSTIWTMLRGCWYGMKAFYVQNMYIAVI